MSKFAAKMDEYKAELAKAHVDNVDEALLEKIARGQGPSIYLKDASLVSCSDETELDRVRNNFATKKLGVQAGDELNNAIKAVCKKYDSRNKRRIVFYYLLTKEMGKESAFA